MKPELLICVYVYGCGTTSLTIILHVFKKSMHFLMLCLDHSLYFIVSLGFIFYRIITGDLKNEEQVLEWLTDDDNRELAGEIEEVNEKMLDRLIESSPFLAVLFRKHSQHISRPIRS